MERAMSVEERIRRAENIYNKRNGGYSTAVPKETPSKKKKKSKRLFMQIFVCLAIYVIFYAVTNREYIFSEQFRNEVSVFFNEKIKISELYSKAKDFVQSSFNNAEKNAKDKSTKAENNEAKESSKKEDANNTENITSEVEKKDENIGGALENIESEKKEQKKDEKESKSNTKESKELSEQELMEKDAKEIKDKINFILPIKGRISSTFGWRNPTTATVPKYHTGIDIAANEGRVIKSATDGKVIMASSEGDYGNHYQIQVDDVILVYAHCKKLYLKEGDNVKQGQEIAEVGSTGNSTGPHLHFEIRRGDKKIDPQLVLNF